MRCYPGVTLSSAVASSPLLVGVTPSIIFGYDANPSTPISFLGIVCTVSGGASLTYSVQITADNPNAAIVHWVNHDTLFNQTGSSYGQVQYPITALRLNVTAYSSGNVNIGVVQWP